MSSGAKRTSLIRNVPRLKGHGQTRPHSYPDQQLERKVGNTTIDYLAQGRLGQAEPFRGYDLRYAHKLSVTRELQGYITAQGPHSGNVVRWRAHI
jgi:hypothetical protein